MATNMILATDARLMLERAGFIVTPITYDRNVRKETDWRARRDISADVLSVKGNSYVAGHDVTFLAHNGMFDVREIENTIAGRHKYAGMSFGGTDYPADAPHDYVPQIRDASLAWDRPGSPQYRAD